MEYWPSAPPDSPSEQGYIAQTAAARIKLSTPLESQLNICLGHFRACLGRLYRDYYWPGIFWAASINNCWPDHAAQRPGLRYLWCYNLQGFPTSYMLQTEAYKPPSTMYNLHTTTPCYNLQFTSHYTVASVMTFAKRLFVIPCSWHYKMSS